MVQKNRRFLIVTRLPNPPGKDGPRTNEAITSSQIRLIDQHGEMVGVVSRTQALDQAYAAGLDLVEISPHVVPPVCKILDYGKYRYEQQKKKAEAKKNQQITVIKEVQVRPGIEEHDLQVKCRSIQRFLEAGDKVKVTLRFRGREVSHQEIGMAVLDRIQAQFTEIAKVETPPKLEGRQAVMIMVPLK